MNRFLSPKVIIFILFLFVASLIFVLSSRYCDDKFSDFFTKIQVTIFNKKSSDNVVLVVLDNKSLNKIKWPWKRNLFSNIFDYLEFACNAKVIIFNNLVVFPDTYNEESDFYFYDNLYFHKKLINSYILVNSNLSGDVLPDDYLNIFSKKTNILIEDKRKNKTESSYKGVIKLPKDFIDNSNILANSQIPEDKDEIVRDYMPVVQLNGKFYPSVALSAFSLYTGINNFVLTDNLLCSDDGCNALKMPVYTKRIKDYIGNNVNAILTRYRWYKPIGEYYTHKVYSAVDVLDSYESYKQGNVPKIQPENFKDKIVIVGLNADKNVWEQLSETPVLKHQADIDVQATMIDNMLSGKFFNVKKNNFSLFITVLFSLFVVFGFKNIKNNIIFSLILSFIYFVYFLCEYIAGVYIPSVSPIITIISVCILKQIYIIISADKKTEMVKHALGKYLSKDVMKRVLQNLDKLKLGGVRAEVTVLFVDIRNFTKIAEENSPSDVTSILNEYFSTIEPVIAKHNGIINKYMGDGALVVFGEPIKTEKHAVNAILCGLEILDKVKILQEKLLKEGKPKITIGIGVNTGEVFAGNIGTEERLEYTVIGDNVNLAYRIEAFNQVLKTQFLISEYTYEFVKDSIDVVKLSQVNIKGKSKPIDIYEVLKIK